MNRAPVDLERLVRSLGGDRGVAAELLRIFVEQTDEKLGAARRHDADGDYAGLREDAHGLKGASANVGADRLRELAASLEAAMKNEEHDRSGELIGEIEAEYAGVRAFILGIV